MRKILVPLSLSALFAAGCATSPSTKTAATDMKASEAQKVYLEGMTVLAENRLSTDKCNPDQSASREKNWKNLVKSANACVKAQNWRGVEQVAQELARVEINSPWSAYFYSLAAERTGDLPRAVWMVDLAMKKAPSAGLFHYQKGRIFWQLQSYKDAVGEMNKAIASDSKLTEAHMFLAQAYHRDLNLDRAVAHYEAVLTADAKQLSCLQGLADVRLQQGQTGKAVTLLNQAVAQQGSDISLRLKLAQASEQVEQFELALSNYKAARELARAGKTSGQSIAVDVNEKIKSLEAKIEGSKPDQKQAKLDQSGKDRAPASVEKGGGK